MGNISTFCSCFSVLVITVTSAVNAEEVATIADVSATESQFSLIASTIEQMSISGGKTML